MNTPIKLNLPDHYRNDGLSGLSIRPLYKSGNPFVAINDRVKMTMSAFRGEYKYEFDTQATDPEKLLTVLEDGSISFPFIASWELPTARFLYDLQTVRIDGRVRSAMYGEWNINQDITQ